MNTEHPKHPQQTIPINQRLYIGIGAMATMFSLCLLSKSLPMLALSAAGLFTSFGGSVVLALSANQISNEKRRLHYARTSFMREKEADSHKSNRVKKELDAARAELTRLRATFSEQRSELTVALAVARAKLSKAEADTDKLEVSITAKVIAATAEVENKYAAEINSLVEKEVQKRSEELEKLKINQIKNAKGTHIRRQQELHFTIEDLKEQIEQLEKRYREEFEITKQNYDKILGDYDTVFAEIGQSVEAAKSDFSATHNSVLQENQRLAHMVQVYNDPKVFKGSSLGDLIGTQVLNFYMSEGIVLDAEKYDKNPTHVEIYVRPRGQAPKTIMDCAEKLQLALECLDKPTFRIEGGCVVIKIRHATSEKLKVSIERLSPDFIFEIIRNSNHYRIAAPTDGGKSVLMDNLIWAMQVAHLGQMSLTLFDPKYPFTSWSGHEPDYKGFAACIKGFETLADTIDKRFAQASTAVAAGGSIPTFKPHFFALDEFEMLMDEARLIDTQEQSLPKAQRSEYIKMLPLLARRGLKMGRGLTSEKGKGIIVAYITQTPLCRRLNLQKDDFYSSTNIILGDNIDYVLENEFSDVITDAKLAKVKRQVQLRRDAGEKYFALVKLGSNFFVWDLPAEGNFAKKYREEVGVVPAHKKSSSTGAQINQGGATAVVELSNQALLTEIEKQSPQKKPAPEDPTQKNAQEGSKQNKSVISNEQHYQCPNCYAENALKTHGSYTTKAGVTKTRYKCSTCHKTTTEPIKSRESGV